MLYFESGTGYCTSCIKNTEFIKDYRLLSHLKGKLVLISIQQFLLPVFKDHQHCQSIEFTVLK